ncbi:hypothetical protein [Streptomyces nogalater]|uniref:Uncharacterized protein n=1 Tax=Streptomyces nogalater TaxID=38314 RepID=A0ABW0WJL0_STRNO
MWSPPGAVGCAVSRLADAKVVSALGDECLPAPAYGVLGLEPAGGGGLGERLPGHEVRDVGVVGVVAVPGGVAEPVGGGADLVVIAEDGVVERRLAQVAVR